MKVSVNTAQMDIIENSQFIVVNASVLPEIFVKVLEVKKLLASREERSSASACKRVGISRSAYYKYRDCVFSYEERLTQNIITISAVLRDEKGVLSNVLSELYSLNVNILTLNQSVPVDGVATVTVSLRLNKENGDVNTYDIQSAVSAVYGVVEVKILSGE